MTTPNVPTKKSMTKCGLCSKTFDMGDIVVECESEHIFHSNCFEDMVDDVTICPTCECPIEQEEDFEEGSAA